MVGLCCLCCRGQPLSYREVLLVARSVASGLCLLHPGIIHRDLKPHNILMDGNGQVRGLCV
jgi:serine/threonine protein kinase